MLFNSEVFVFLFMPLTILGFYAFAYFAGQRAAIAWLVLMSCIFYGWFRIGYLLLLAVLIIFNYFLGAWLSNNKKIGRKAPLLLFFGIAVNLGVLIHYKYTNFFISNYNLVFGTDFLLHNIILPLGISFFIFQKIAYLVDAYRGEAQEYNFLDFCLFVMYFPQLIAGPIVHHKELIPQFRQNTIFKFNATDISIGIFMFSIGICKKIIIADQLAIWIDAPFQAALQGWKLTFFESWVAALGFTFQIYFDFSAYSDMALGIALMIGIRLPLNFDSPYKSVNIIDFWRRWHMTLSRFLRDYIYIPLGGNRKGKARRYVNLAITMIIGGFWHGAAWTFVFWGILHGLFLTINHWWQYLKKAYGVGLQTNWLRHTGSQFITFIAVVIGWVFFRSESFRSAIIILKGMIGMNGVALAARYEAKLGSLGILFKQLGIQFNDSGVAYLGGKTRIIAIMVLFAIIWLLPNTQQICAAFRPALQASELKDKTYSWWRFIPFTRLNASKVEIVLSPTLGMLLAAGVLAAIILQMISANPTQNFIYFQF